MSGKLFAGFSVSSDVLIIIRKNRTDGEAGNGMKKYFTMILLLCLVAFTVPAHASNLLLWSYKDGLPGEASSVLVDSSGIAYVSMEHSGVRALDLNAPGGPSLIGGWDTKSAGAIGPSREMVLKDNVLIVAQRDYGTRFLDVSDPANPVLLATLDNPVLSAPGRSASSRLALEGNTLYVSSVTGGFSRVDVSDPANPRMLDTITFQRANGVTIESQGISIAGDHAYVATPWGGWSIVDISNAARMEIVAQLEQPGGLHGGWDVHVQNGVAFVLMQGYGVQIYDVSNVRNVSLINEVLFQAPELFGPDTPPADIKFLSDKIAAISYGSLGVYIYDFNDLNAPTLLDTLTANEMIAVNMFLSGSTLLVAGHSGGLFAFDVSQFQTPIPASFVLGATGLAVLLNKRRKERSK